MDLVSWSLNAIDQIFSTRRLGKGEPSCPDGTFPAGYTMDSWEKWRVVCLASLSIEDVEDAYLFGFMVIGFLLIGAGGYLIYLKHQEMSAAIWAKLPGFFEGTSRALNTQTEAFVGLARRLDAIIDQNRSLTVVPELLRRMDNNWEKLSARLGEV